MSKVRPSDIELKTTNNNNKTNLKDYYENEIAKKRKNCTDILCLILFLVFLIAQIVLSCIIFFSGGDPKNLLLPRDSTGQLCVDSKPYLFYFNLIECVSVNALVTGCTSPTICVSKCPDSNLYYQFNTHRDLLYKEYCINEKLSSYFGGSVPSSVDQQTYLDLAKKKICPVYTLQSKSLYGRCLPSIVSNLVNTAQEIVATDTQTNQTLQINDLTQGLNYDLVSKAIKYLVDLTNIKNIAQFILEDFINSVYLIVLLLIIASVTSFVYIIILRFILAPLIYISLIALVGALSFAVYYCISKYIYLKNTNTTEKFEFSTDFNYYMQLSVTWLVVGIIAGVLLLIVLLIILVLIKRIRLAIQLLCEASKAVTSVFLTLIFPLIPLILQLGFLAYFITTAVVLACSGTSLFRVANSTNSSMSIGDSCKPGVTIQGVECVFYRYGFDSTTIYNSVISFLQNYQYIPQLYNLFMFFWVQAFIVGLNQMILAGCFGIWYWSQSKSSCILCTSIKDTLVYHLGSIAFGSLLIAICKIIRTIIQMVERRLKSAVGKNNKLSCIISFMSCCCKCCLWCLEKVLKFINRNAYIMIAIYGRNFCKSARDAIKLLASNPLRAFVLDRVTDFILFLGRLLITTGVGVLAFYFFSRSFYIDPKFQKYFAPELRYYWVPLICVIIGTYFITKTFFTVFEMAVDTIFLCAMKDLSINDGSEQKPYLMSKKLLKILSVKNVKKEDNQDKIKVEDVKF